MHFGPPSCFYWHSAARKSNFVPIFGKTIFPWQLEKIFSFEMELGKPKQPHWRPLCFGKGLLTSSTLKKIVFLGNLNFDTSTNFFNWNCKLFSGIFHTNDFFYLVFLVKIWQLSVKQMLGNSKFNLIEGWCQISPAIILLFAITLLFKSKFTFPFNTI